MKQGEPIFFSAPLEEPELEGKNEEELRTIFSDIRRQIDELDAREPKQMSGEAYDLWADRHEALEDIQDEILDLLEDCL